MNSKTPTPSSDTEPVHDSNQAASKDVLANDRLARRRLLLSTVTGSAVLLSASPIKALAQTCSTQQCSISGMKSANHSFKPGECEELCGGYSPGWWMQEKSDGNNGQGGGQGNNKSSENSSSEIVPRNDWPISYQLLTNTIFTKSTLVTKSGKSPSLFEVMRNYANTDERHWICAYLNSMSPPPGYKFPYTPSQVLNFYFETGPHSASDALRFFKDYMETHNA